MTTAGACTHVPSLLSLKCKYMSLVLMKNKAVGILYFSNFLTVYLQTKK